MPNQVLYTRHRLVCSLRQAAGLERSTDLHDVGQDLEQVMQFGEAVVGQAALPPKVLVVRGDKPMQGKAAARLPP